MSRVAFVPKVFVVGQVNVSHYDERRYLEGVVFERMYQCERIYYWGDMAVGRAGGRERVPPPRFLAPNFINHPLTEEKVVREEDEVVREEENTKQMSMEKDKTAPRLDFESGNSCSTSQSLYDMYELNIVQGINHQMNLGSLVNETGSLYKLSLGLAQMKSPDLLREKDRSFSFGVWVAIE
ncbi:unnamed protein product [Sphenostylis stenocarpa]|uniref:Uncharacterized protein n=1 Tax=Sphenostylis stenocarpa TaxID=92480 RepID=A0AA86VNU4_9FABA|nr:unnamed protein product [Sphenostylis stenocarpa]